MTTQLIIPPESRIIPLSVLVHWSESKLFNDDTTYAFDDFENMALEAAMDNWLVVMIKHVLPSFYLIIVNTNADLI